MCAECDSVLATLLQGEKIQRCISDRDTVQRCVVTCQHCVQNVTVLL